ncbi:binding-protein-dependent transport systems inner membrane component [Petrotoga mobilis SJ95]|jgi:sn-glycerol 3-phosphate transport system permease protein|uniref:Binding-protein-dependent transport systems inner membrane component n=1 Tax=Petrotoga mobilis (strain DSM 10674 / SJ95) TaxID=403833 RepID=A9BFU8_PETMO|nr:MULTISPECIES: sugar ABC transporter permease [Petrotoga]ABX31444.1 binding-protein-dependent transport systems inner membrane component [Petrotoga mobilis SJ95]MBL5981738.1 glycerol-3-phosphate ABC transporter permease [Petrotoga sp. 8T1HF07.NaAc.6.1]RLL85100.1 glycerol-3-phosphate ABC transporter permease [Petrotoga sp. Shatin.DS.tank11.9.2.9.3]RLL89842.1 glycerol-3-phosphate ABC transporter permease [Petrotoga sp. HKA.pet.4.5]
MKWGKYTPYLLLAPTLIIIALFIYWPAINSFLMSFYKISPFGDKRIFAGLDNYIKLFENEAYWDALKITIIYIVTTVIIVIILGYLIAQLLDNKVFGMKIYRTLIFVPYVISFTIGGALWTFMLNPVAGHVNYILSRITGESINWLNQVPYALISVIVASVWKMLPFSIIFYLAGLQSISESIIESSLIDGANVWQRMWKIKFPILSPITFYLVIMNITNGMFESFGIIDIMTRGGPLGSTTTLIYKLYQDAFFFQKTSLAAAESVILFIIMSIITFLYFRFGEKRVHYQ